MSKSSRVPKNRHAVVLGRKGGRIGAKVTNSKLSRDQRVANARKAAAARWARWRAKKKTIPIDALPLAAIVR